MWILYSNLIFPICPILWNFQCQNQPVNEFGLETLYSLLYNRAPTGVNKISIELWPVTTVPWSYYLQLLLIYFSLHRCSYFCFLSVAPKREFLFVESCVNNTTYPPLWSQEIWTCANVGQRRKRQHYRRALGIWIELGRNNCYY